MFLKKIRQSLFSNKSLSRRLYKQSEESIEDMIRQIQTVNKEEIIKVSQKLKLILSIF